MTTFRIRCGTCVYGSRAQDHFSIDTLWEGDDLSQFPFQEHVDRRTTSWAQKPFEFSGGHSDLETLIWTEKRLDGEWQYYRLPKYYILVADTYYEKFAKQEGKEVGEIAN